MSHFNEKKNKNYDADNYSVTQVSYESEEKVSYRMMVFVDDKMELMAFGFKQQGSCNQQKDKIRDKKSLVPV